MEYIWLGYPKETFKTFLCPASSKRVGFRGLRGYKTFRDLFLPLKPPKRALRDTEVVDEVSLRTTWPLFVHNLFMGFISGVLPQTPNAEGI